MSLNSRIASVFGAFFLAFLPLAIHADTAAQKGAPGSVNYSGFKVGLLLDKGGKDDKSFNSAAYQGAMAAKKNWGVAVKTIEATDDNAFEPMLRKFAERKYDLIISIGVSQAEAVQKVAALFPSTHFAVVDADVKANNVRALLFQEQEGSYLVGAIAALTSKTGKVGFIGGMDIPLIRRFELGYGAGAKKVRPGISLVSNYIGVTNEAWNNPAKCKELAISQYDAGADVIFAAAGASNAGLFDAAEEKRKFAIGVDSNQNWIKPGLVLTSMLKRVDVAVEEAIRQAASGKFQGGVQRFGLANGGIDYSVDQYNEALIPHAVRAQVEQLKAEIVAGKLEVPDYYLKRAP